MKQEKAKYLDPNLPVDARVKDLLGRMTLEEKIRQMNMAPARGKVFVNRVYSFEKAQEFFGDVGIGGIQDMRKGGEESADSVNKIQDYLVNHTRLGIPALIIAECLHGLMSPEATVYPQAIGLASTWDTDLMKKVAEASAKEARSYGVSQVLAPNLDIARDPRWGRVEETYGEDPYLIEKMGVAYTEGLQGDASHIDDEHVVATLKHFAAHGSPEGGVNISPVSVGERQLRELFLPPFKKAIQEAGALSVMPAYSELDGVPLHSNQRLLDTILKQEFGFSGYVISDFGGIDMLIEEHFTATSYDDAAIQTLEAGMDMEAPEIRVFRGLEQLVREGKVSEDIINRATARILRVKFIAGLFEKYHTDLNKTKEIVNCREHKALALKAAQESIVLLKNENDVLPLVGDLDSITVIGPNATKAQIGNYSYDKEEAVSPLQGLQNRLSKQTRIHYAKGCDLTGLSKDGFTEAVEAAKKSKVAVLFVGGTSAVKGGKGWGSQEKTIATCGEGYDRHSLELPGVQEDLVKAIQQTGTLTIVVMITGRPQTIPWIAENVPAIIQVWYPGEEGGNAIADVLLGQVNPSGKLNMTFPKHVGQLPMFYNYKPRARGIFEDPGSPENPGRHYVFLDTQPLYPFGYGLSYTQFVYTDLQVTPAKIQSFEKFTVSVKVKNVGARQGKEVVQLYVNDLISSVTTPVKVLRDFAKIELQPSEEKLVTFEMGHEDLELFNVYFEPTVEPGDFEIMVGDLKTKLTVQ